MDWLSPGGQTYTTRPGSRLLFPTLCRPTAPAVIDPSVEPLDDAVRGLKMPRRNRTRAQTRTRAIDERRRANEADRYEPTLLAGGASAHPGRDCL